MMIVMMMMMMMMLVGSLEPLTTGTTTPSTSTLGKTSLGGKSSPTGILPAKVIAILVVMS